MATSYKILGQSNPAATTSTDLYTVPALSSAVVSTIIVCNQAATDATFRISTAVAGLALTAKQYLAYDITVPGNGLYAFTIGVGLATTDVIRVYASSATCSFSAFGTVLT